MKYISVLLAVFALPTVITSQAGTAIFPGPVFPVVDNVGGMEVADLDGDGLLDIVLAAYQERVAVLRGLRNGSFEETEFYGNQIDFTDVVLVDLDEDGVLDVVAADGTATVLATLIGNGAGAFDLRPLINIDDGSRPAPQRLEAGDLDGDGHADIAIVTEQIPAVLTPVVPNKILWMKGDGAGNLQLPPIQLATSVSGEPQDLLVADFDGDGVDDIAVTNDANQVAIYHGGPGGPRWLPEQVLPTRQQPAGLAAGHLDGDNHLDLVVANRGSDSVSVYFGAPFGLRRPVHLPTGPSPQAPVIGDADGDGAMDVVLSVLQGIEVLRGDGLGAFSSAVQSHTGNPVFRLNLVDLDGKGGDDLVFLDDYQDGPGYLMAVGGGRYGRTRAVANGAFRDDITTADVNLDGNFDLLSLLKTNPSGLSVQLGNGKGRFSAPIIHPMPTPPEGNGLGDLDGDGIPDVATGSITGFYPFLVLFGDGSGGFASEAQYTVPSSTTASTKIVDLNGDGALDVLIGLFSGVSVMLNDGAGGLLPVQSVGISNGPDYMETADLNVDGSMDFVYMVENTIGPELFVNLNDGSGLGFTTSTHFTNQTTARGLTIGDLDQDGAPDVLNGGYQNNNGLSLFLNDGAGAFPTWASFLPIGASGLGNRFFDLAAVDLDFDGLLDLAYACDGPRGVGVLIGDGAGGFSEPVYHKFDVSTGYRPSIAVADFDSDGRPDVVYEDGTATAELFVLINQRGARIGALPYDRLQGPSLRPR